MTHLQTSQSPQQRERRLTPREQAVEMRARAGDAADEVARRYWLWLAREWEKTADRDRYRLPLRPWDDE